MRIRNPPFQSSAQGSTNWRQSSAQKQMGYVRSQLATNVVVIRQWVMFGILESKLTHDCDSALSGGANGRERTSTSLTPQCPFSEVRTCVLEKKYILCPKLEIEANAPDIWKKGVNP